MLFNRALLYPVFSEDSFQIPYNVVPSGSSATGDWWRDFEHRRGDGVSLIEGSPPTTRRRSSWGACVQAWGHTTQRVGQSLLTTRSEWCNSYHMAGDEFNAHVGARWETRCTRQVTALSPTLRCGVTWKVSQWGLCKFESLDGSPVILWISLGGKPKWLPLKYGYHDVMRRSPIVYNGNRRRQGRLISPPCLLHLLFMNNRWMQNTAWPMWQLCSSWWHFGEPNAVYFRRR